MEKEEKGDEGHVVESNQFDLCLACLINERCVVFNKLSLMFLFCVRHREVFAIYVYCI